MNNIYLVLEYPEVFSLSTWVSVLGVSNLGHCVFTNCIHPGWQLSHQQMSNKNIIRNILFTVTRNNITILSQAFNLSESSSGLVSNA